jgi:hypothetical protein
MALTAKLKKAVDQGLITKAQAELLAASGKQKTPVKNTANVPGFFTRVGQILGGVLALSGLVVFTYWANINFAPWGYVLLMLGYVCISLAAFSWLREKGQRLPTAITGFIYTCVVCGFLISLFTAAGWLDPHSIEPQWLIAHTITILVLAASAYISSRFSHWLTDLNLALSIAGVVSVLIGHLTQNSGFFDNTVNGLAWLFGGLLTIMFAYAWRMLVNTSQLRNTTAIHVVAAIYLYVGLATLEPGISLVPQSFSFLALHVLLIVFGAFIQRRAYIIVGAIGIIGFAADYMWDWLNNPLLFSFITIGLGLFLVYGTTRAEMLLPTRLAKKLPLPAWLTRN